MINIATKDITIELPDDNTPPKVVILGKEVPVVSLNYNYRTSEDNSQGKNSLILEGYLDKDSDTTTIKADLITGNIMWRKQ